MFKKELFITCIFKGLSINFGTQSKILAQFDYSTRIFSYPDQTQLTMMPQNPESNEITAQTTVEPGY